jgi:hypothetical protein
MDEKLDFSLPEKKTKNSLTQKIVILLLLILVVLTLINTLKTTRSETSVARSGSGLSPEQARELASKLADRNLYTNAAKIWQDYLSSDTLPDTERAKILFKTGTLLEKAGAYEGAIEYYYRSEITAEIPELESRLNTHIKNCFEKLGMFSALRYELMDRTSFEQQEKSGSKIVAEIGPEKITEADLEALIEQTIDNQLAPMTAFMTAEQKYEQKKKLMEQFKTPTAKSQFLQSWLAQEVLYRDALERELMEEPEVKKVVEEMTRGLLSRQLVNREMAEKINITQTDLQTYYQANKDKFVEPADENDPNSVERQKSFDEVREQVMTELASRKSQDVQNDLIKQMMDKYNVIIHTSALSEPGEKKSETAEKTQK